MIFAFQGEASLYADLAHFPLERSPNGRFMRLFVFADLMVVAAEYAGSIDMQDLADVCLPRADAANRAQLATVLMPQASPMHEKLELLARRDAIAARVKEVLAIAADGRDDVLDLVIDLDLAEAAA